MENDNPPIIENPENPENPKKIKEKVRAKTKTKTKTKIKLKSDIPDLTEDNIESVFDANFGK